MKNFPRVAVCLALCGIWISSPAAAKKGPSSEQIESWATCAVAKNADDVKWMYIIQSDQSGLKGRPLDGAFAHAVFLLARGCAPDGTGYDNKLVTALSERAMAIWNGNLDSHSLPRSIDPWADCMAKNHPARSRAYLYARDFSFAGPKLIVEGVDPINAFFVPTEECEEFRPAEQSVDLTDLYARLNYRLRVEPRLTTTQAVGGATK